MSETNGNSFALAAGDADEFNRRTFAAKIGDRELHRDKFDFDSAKACDAFAAAVQRLAPPDFVTWAVREQLNLGDDKYCTEPAQPFAAWMRARMAKAISRGQEAAAGDDSEFPVYTLADLAKADLTVSYIVEGLIAERQPLILAGPRKALKTSLLVELTYCLARAEPFLGHFPIREAGRSAFFTGESGLAVVYETFQRVAGERRDKLPDLGDSIIISEHVPRMDDPNSLAKMIRTAKSHCAENIIIDPTYQAMPGGDAGNLFIQGAMLKEITEACLSIGATLILAHHTRKNVADPFAPPELEDIAWAGFQEYARQWILTGRRAKYEPGTGEHHLWLSVGGSAGHSGCWALDVSEGQYQFGSPRVWRRQLMTAEDAREQVKDAIDAKKDAARDEKTDRNKKAIVQGALKMPDRQGTQSDIRTRAGVNGQQFNIAFAELLADGHFQEIEITKGNNRTYPAYKLVVTDK